MQRPMRQKARQVTDRALICAMLDEMDTMFLGIHDEPAPYVVPLNFGYALEEDTLVFYFHCAQAGQKLELLAKNPHVSLTAARFISYAEAPVKGHLHDYRSVMARGVARQIDPEQEAAVFDRAYRLLLAHNHRTPLPDDPQVLARVQLWRIVCRMEDVTAKAEITPKAEDEVPFAPQMQRDTTF